MQISRIIEFMQREQCENENEEIKFILWHPNFVIDTMRKQYYRQMIRFACREALAECNLDLIKDITSFTVH